MSKTTAKTKNYIDPSIARKRQILQNDLQEYGGFPMFSMIELNMLGRCNRTCSFCPISDPAFYDLIDKNSKFSRSLYTKLLEDLKAINFKGLIVYSGLSEPLLIKDIGS